MFCNFLSNVYHISYDAVKPCCWIKNTSANILEVDKIKNQFAVLQQVTDWIPDCSYCYNLEKVNVESPRLRAAAQDIFDDSEPGDATKVEIQIDEDCNAACIICGPWHSTTWQQYLGKTINAKLSDDQKIPTFYAKNTTVEERIKAVKEIVNFDKTKQLHFFGGEPFKTDTHLRFLREIKYPENIKLVYVTNGSIFPTDETLELWKKFKHINIAVSIDGTEEHFNYLRWPLQWNQVTEVLKKYIPLLEKGRFTINCSFTATPLNMLYADRYNAWAEDFFKDVSNLVHLPGWFTDPHPANEGGPINLFGIPPKLQEEIKSKFGADHKITKLMREFDPVKYEEFIKHLELHDKHRKLSWRDTFPEIQHYFPKL